MGIDNNAILMVGLDEMNDDDLLKIPGVTQEMIDDEELPDWLYDNDESDNLIIKHLSSYSGNVWFIGYELGDSGSYNYQSYDPDYFCESIKNAKTKFMGIFGKCPNVILFNHQW